MSKKFFLPVKNDTVEGFELKEKDEKDLTVKDRRYLEHTAELQEDPESEAKLRNALMEYFADERDPIDADNRPVVEPEDKE